MNDYNWYTLAEGCFVMGNRYGLLDELAFMFTNILNTDNFWYCPINQIDRALFIT
jgi:hypothetical protein